MVGVHDARADISRLRALADQMAEALRPFARKKPCNWYAEDGLDWRGSSQRPRCPRSIREDEMMRVLVCGGRDYTDYLALVSVLDEHRPITCIIHGGADGADKLAGLYASLCAIP
eukprot:gene21008-21762_t